MKRNNKKGFTIVELVIVIAVIGILSAILIPTFIGLTRNANEVKLQENLNGAYEQFVERELDDDTPTAYELLDKKDVYMATALIDAEGVEIYVYRAQEADESKWSWSKVDKEETGIYTELDNQTHNGYHVYKYTPAA